MLDALVQEPTYTPKVLIADSHLDRRRLLYVPHPLPLCICSPDVQPVAIEDKPDRDLIGFACFPAVVGESRRLFPGHPPQSCQFGGFHTAEF